MATAHIPDLQSLCPFSLGISPAGILYFPQKAEIHPSEIRPDVKFGVAMVFLCSNPFLGLNVTCWGKLLPLLPALSAVKLELKQKLKSFFVGDKESSR